MMTGGRSPEEVCVDSPMNSNCVCREPTFGDVENGWEKDGKEFVYAYGAQEWRLHFDRSVHCLTEI